MKTHKFQIISFLTIGFFWINPALAQFEQKMTINFSLGGISPMGYNEYIYHNKYTVSGVTYDDTWLFPYIFSNYKKGFSFTGGVQFNINRFFSVGTGIGFEKINGWEYTDEYYYNGTRVSRDFLSWKIYDLTNTTTVVKSGTNDLKLNNFSIGVFPRFNLLYGKRVNPYIFTQITFNYTDINYVNNRKDAYESLGRINEYNSTTSSNLRNSFQNTPQNSFGVGFYSGIGFDINLSQNMGFYVQGGYSFISINKGDLEDANLEPENFKTIKAEVGIKLSFFKAKDI